jgi:hypothetical protein
MWESRGGKWSFSLGQVATVSPGGHRRCPDRCRDSGGRCRPGGMFRIRRLRIRPCRCGAGSFLGGSRDCRTPCRGRCRTPRVPLWHPQAKSGRARTAKRRSSDIGNRPRHPSRISPRLGGSRRGCIASVYTGYDPASSAAQLLRARLGKGGAAARLTRGLLRPKVEVSAADDPRKHGGRTASSTRDCSPMGGCSASPTVTDAAALSELLAYALPPPAGRVGDRPWRAELDISRQRLGCLVADGPLELLNSGTGVAHRGARGSPLVGAANARSAAVGAAGLWGRCNSGAHFKRFPSPLSCRNSGQTVEQRTSTDRRYNAVSRQMFKEILSLIAGLRRLRRHDGGSDQMPRRQRRCVSAEAQ